MLMSVCLTELADNLKVMVYDLPHAYHKKFENEKNNHSYQFY